MNSLQVQRIIEALLDTPAKLDAYHNDTEFYALVRGIASTAPALVDFEMSKIPERTRRHQEALHAALTQPSPPLLRPERP